MSLSTSPFRSSPALVAATVVALLSASSCGGGDGGGATKAPAVANTSGAPKGGASDDLSGSSATLAYQAGKQHVDAGEFDKAQPELERAIQLDPKMSEAHYLLGKLKVQQSNQKIWAKARDLELLQQGIDELTKACELQPSNDEYLFHLGRAYYLKDDYDSALKHLGKAVELNPKLGGAWKQLGQTQVDAGKTELGRDSFQKALEISPNDANLHYRLAQALEVLKDLPGARAEYEKSIELDPTEYEVHGRLSQVCGKLGDSAAEAKAAAEMERWRDYDQRLERRMKAVNKNPNDAVALRRMGETYFEAGDWENAVTWFLRAIKINKRDWRAHLWTGVCRRNQKDYVYATHFLKEAEFLAPDVLDPKLELVRLYAEKKDDAALDELVSKFEAGAKEDGNALYFMAEVVKEVGREADAKRLFDKAAALGVTQTPTDFAMADEEAEEE